MHSRIFQISKMWIEKENYLNEDTLQQGDGSFYDYCAEIDDEKRKEDIRYLVNTALPKGMFELVGDDTMRYIGGVEQWKENFVTNIRKKAEAITTENMLEFVGPVYQLEKALENPLDIAYHFYLDGDGYQSFAEKSALAQPLTYLRWGWIPLKKPIPNLPLAPWQRCAAWKPTPR